MLQRFEFTKVCMGENTKSILAEILIFFQQKMTYLNALLSFLLSSRFSEQSEAF